MGAKNFCFHHAFDTMHKKDRTGKENALIFSYYKNYRKHICCIYTKICQMILFSYEVMGENKTTQEGLNLRKKMLHFPSFEQKIMCQVGTMNWKEVGGKFRHC